MSNERGSKPQPLQAATTSYRGAVRYTSEPDVRIPGRPRSQVRSSGLFGFGVDHQDDAHDRRLRELYYLGVEAAYAEQVATGFDLKGVATASQGLRHAEEIVYGLPEESVAGMLAADLTGEMAARARIRHARYAEALDGAVMEILHRR